MVWGKFGFGEGLGKFMYVVFGDGHGVVVVVDLADTLRCAARRYSLLVG